MTFRVSRFTLMGLTIVGAQAALGAYIAVFGPIHPIPMHFNADGVVNRWGGRVEAGALIGFMAALSALVVGGAGALSQRADGARLGPKSVRTAQAITLFVTTALCGFEAALTFGAPAQGHGSPSLQMAFLGMLLAGVGAFLGKVGPNPLVGVRTPWTFSSHLAWDKSNRLAGRLLLWGGLMSAAAAFFVPQPLGLRAAIFGVLAIAAITVFESWRVWRRDPDRTSAM